MRCRERRRTVRQEKEEREGQGCCPLLRYQGGLAKRKGQHQPWGEEEREFCHPCQEGGWREDQKGGTRFGEGEERGGAREGGEGKGRGRGEGGTVAKI
jgi:hypothetical protein